MMKNIHYVENTPCQYSTIIVAVKIAKRTTGRLEEEEIQGESKRNDTLLK